LRAAIVSSETILIPTIGLSGGGVYEYTGGSWALRNNGLPAITLYGLAVAANPANADEWLALFATNSSGTVQQDGSGNLVGSDGSTGVLWRWDGSTWANIPIATPTLGSNTRLSTDLAWRTTGWAFVARRTYGTWVYQGVGTTQGTTATSSTPVGRGIDIMADGRAVIGSSGDSNPNNDNIWYTDGSSLIRPGTPSGEDRDLQFIAAYPTGNRVVCPSNDNDAGTLGRIYASADYSTTQPDLKINSAVGTSAQVTTDERVYVGNRTGIAEITDLFGTPSVSVVAASGVDVGRIGMDKQTRTLVAALNSAKTTVYLWDGTTETTIDATSLTAANLLGYVEVIRRV
jgi:hypothetical protein